MSHRYPCLAWLHAVPNGGYRNQKEAVILKKEGVTPGIGDLFLPWPKFFGGELLYCGLYIEIKTGKDTLKSAQKRFRTHCEKAKYKYVVVKTAQQGIDILIDYVGRGK